MILVPSLSAFFLASSYLNLFLYLWVFLQLRLPYQFGVHMVFEVVHVHSINRGSYT